MVFTYNKAIIIWSWREIVEDDYSGEVSFAAILKWLSVKWDLIIVNKKVDNNVRVSKSLKIWYFAITKLIGW